MNAERIQQEIQINESEHFPTGTCVCCGTEMTPVDIATQALRQPSAGKYSCQTCLPIGIDWYADRFKFTLSR